jgi:chromosome segregation ATPase
MTVPGKGGRPRKWRSDADRQRAWRARTNGLDEPSTLVQALDDGDKLAAVWQQVRDRDAQLATANATIKSLRREREQARRELASEQRRWGWIESRNTELVAQVDRLETERDALAGENTELRQRLARLTQTTSRPTVEAPPASTPRPLSRAERRQLERQQRRRQP